MSRGMRTCDLGTEKRKAIPEAAREQLAVTSESLAADYPQFATSLFNLIKNSEQKIDR